MSVFLGVALMQWLTGVAASSAVGHGGDPMLAAMATTAALLLVSVLAFALLPWPDWAHGGAAAATVGTPAAAGRGTAGNERSPPLPGPRRDAG